MKTCAVEGCERRHYARAMCNTHYQRVRRKGSLEPTRYRRRCEVSGCDQFVKGHGLCPMHYSRLASHGTTADPRTEAGVRFWAKADRSGGPQACWTWHARINKDGYGIFWFDGRNWFAHRWAFQQMIGPAEPLSLDHLCRNRACVNPAHLEAVPIGENVLRGYGAAAVNARKTHCKRGHPFDELNTYRIKSGGRMCRACAMERRRRLHVRW